MSTDNDSQDPKSERQERLESVAASVRARNTVQLSARSVRSSAEAELEQALADEKDARKEDRFIFAVILLAIFNVWLLHDVTTWSLPVVAGIMQLFALLIVARRMGVQEVQYWLNRLLNSIGPSENEEKIQPSARSSVKQSDSNTKREKSDPPKGQS